MDIKVELSIETKLLDNPVVLNLLFQIRNAITLAWQNDGRI